MTMTAPCRCTLPERINGHTFSGCPYSEHHAQVARRWRGAESEVEALRAEVEQLRREIDVLHDVISEEGISEHRITRAHARAQEDDK